ncbi:MAG TPA: D-alanyl-D-alanine carboxypeptidase/D-alanyl-D-alanine-endopeptidase [Gemmatimonadaceae bacterium]|nr:D-alanyl-D-alanine carboxypeptidase/D-alanyl-D-alanine-endopeptidase [Gemmatimonadaceae bacterium]
MTNPGTRSMRALAGFAACVAVAACATVTHTVRPGSSREELRTLIDSLTSQPEFRGGFWGVLVVNPRTGDTIYSKNAGRLFMPASNMKIVTSSAALTLLGPDYTYKTTFLVDGPVQDSLLDGDLIVIGRGDPTISDNMRGVATTVMDALADSIRAHGIRQITGRLVRVGNAFPDSTRGYGWEWDDLGEYYAAGVDELIFNEGMAPTTPRPPPDTVRDSAYSGPAKDPATAYLNALDDALIRKGITLDAGVLDSILPTPIKMDTLFTFTSLPMRNIIPALMKPSQNQIAEILLKTIGLERGGMGTADSARKIVGQLLLSWGVQQDGFVIRDGSGLSRHDMVTPETLVRVLDRIQQDTAFAVFYNALPIAGIDGTLEHRMKGTPAEGNVRAKTGSISYARSLSGYVTTADGERLIFSMLANNWVTPSSVVTGIMDRIAVALAVFRTR